MFRRTKAFGALFAGAVVARTAFVADPWAPGGPMAALTLVALAVLPVVAFLDYRDARKEAGSRVERPSQLRVEFRD